MSMVVDLSVSSLPRPRPTNRLEDRIRGVQQSRPALGDQVYPGEPDHAVDEDKVETATHDRYTVYDQHQECEGFVSGFRCRQGLHIGGRDGWYGSGSSGIIAGIACLAGT